MIGWALTEGTKKGPAPTLRPLLAHETLGWYGGRLVARETRKGSTAPPVGRLAAGAYG